MSNAAVVIERAGLTLGQFALRNIDLALGTDEILVVLGPNGAGKSVLLETIAGFHRPASGRILIGGRDVTVLPPEKRRVSLMFQNFGLFPHLTVAGNVAFGLRARPRDGGKDIFGLLAQFGIAHLADRYTQDLSPGEKQRTALARALAAHSDLFLFDEPFSALDLRTRDVLRDDLKQFLRRAGAPAILVSHDQTDAFLLADRVAVLYRGTIRQVGTVADVFRRPADAVVADIVGVENILAGKLLDKSGGHWRIEVGEQILVATANGVPGDDVSLGIRADDVKLRVPSEGGTDVPDDKTNRLRGRVVDVASLGPVCKVTVDCGFKLAAYVTHRRVQTSALGSGVSVIAEIEVDAVRLLAKREMDFRTI